MVEEGGNWDGVTLHIFWRSTRFIDCRYFLDGRRAMMMIKPIGEIVRIGLDAPARFGSNNNDNQRAVT